MIQIVIVEDEKSVADAIISCLHEFGKKHNVGLEASYFDNAESFISEDTRKYDLVLMDIELPGLDGMAAVKQLRQKNPDVLVIFISNLAQYAVEGYAVNAFDFLVKPVNFFNLEIKLRRAIKCLSYKSVRNISIVSRDGMQFIKSSSIKYVEVIGHTLIFHTNGGKISATGSLKNIEERLAGLPFALCNRCYLVNLRYVTEIKENIVVVGGEELQISAPRRKSFLTALNNYFGVGGKIT